MSSRRRMDRWYERCIKRQESGRSRKRFYRIPFPYNPYRVSRIRGTMYLGQRCKEGDLEIVLSLINFYKHAKL